MKLDKRILRSTAIALVILGGLLFLALGATGIGLASFVIGILNLVSGLVSLLARRQEAAAAFLLTGGILLLSGFTLCSAFPLSLH